MQHSGRKAIDGQRIAAFHSGCYADAVQFLVCFTQYGLRMLYAPEAWHTDNYDHNHSFNRSSPGMDGLDSYPTFSCNGSASLKAVALPISGASLHGQQGRTSVSSHA